MKKYDWRVVLGIVVFSLVAAIANNFRVASEKQVTWFGGQEILIAPPEALQ